MHIREKYKNGFKYDKIQKGNFINARMPGNKAAIIFFKR